MRASRPSVSPRDQGIPNDLDDPLLERAGSRLRPPADASREGTHGAPVRRGCAEHVDHARARDPQKNSMHFSDLQLLPAILRAVTEEGYDVPTPIQQQAIPHVLTGRDLLGCAQTGTGKTAAFALPILQRLATTEPTGRKKPIRVLVLTPTRELAAQIGESFATYGRHLRFRHAVIFGGVGQLQQERALAAGPEILVATPGRLLDLASQGKVSLRDLEIFVLDEADRMLDMGFIHDVRRVIALLPERRQSLFFSATMPPDIMDLSARILTDPARVAVTPIASTAEKIQQHVYFVDKSHKRALLEHVLQDPAIERALVFTRTKHGANRVAEHLEKARIGAAAIHGNKSQNARERALSGFKEGSTRVLVATDIAARGIDVDGVTHVINFDLPEVPESYVHRIGRTARAGASGIAFSFCDSEERSLLWAIERLIRMKVNVVEEHPLRNAAPRPVEPREQVRNYGPRNDGRQQHGARHDGRRPQQQGGRSEGQRAHGDGQRTNGNGQRPSHGNGQRTNGNGQRAHGDGQRGHNGHRGDGQRAHEARRPHEARIPSEAARPQGEGAAASNTQAGQKPRHFGGRPQRRYAQY
ncbi:ATP-dependent RNA helicase RhlE [Minicystis rosea]|nr:ATP-dependent RNA helicase RhlE [Minicystis rosea]